MKKVDWNTRYNTISVYVFLTAAAVIVFKALVENFSSVSVFLNNLAVYLNPFLYGFVIAALTSPLLHAVEAPFKYLKVISTKARRRICLLITFILVALMISIFSSIVFPSIVSSITAVAKSIPYFSSRINALFEWLGQYIHMEQIAQYLPKEVNDFFSDLTASLGTYVSNTISMVTMALLQAVTLTSQLTSSLKDLVLGIIIATYMLLSKESLYAQCKRIIYAFLPEKGADKLLAVLNKTCTTFSSFFAGKVIDSLIIGILCAAGMYCLNMPFIALVSIIVGVTNIIPYFGPFIGAIPGFLLVLIGSSDPMQSVFFLLFILILQQLDGNVIGPFILGQYVGMDSIWILFALLLFGGMFGVVGLVIGVPLLAVMFWFARGIMEKKLEEKGRSTDWRDYASSHNPLLTNQSYFSEKLRRLRENIGNFFRHFSLLGSLKWIFGKVGAMLVFLLKMIFEFLKNLLLWILNRLDKEDNGRPPEQDGKPKS